MCTASPGNCSFFCCKTSFLSACLFPCCHASCCIPGRQASVICVPQCTAPICALQRAHQATAVWCWELYPAVFGKRESFSFYRNSLWSICALGGLLSISGGDFKELLKKKKKKKSSFSCKIILWTQRTHSLFLHLFPIQTDCFNYIKILLRLNSTHLYVCGTFAFSPLCTYIVSKVLQEFISLLPLN